MSVVLVYRDASHLVDVAHFTLGECLSENVADGCCLDGSSLDGYAESLLGQSVEKFVAIRLLLCAKSLLVRAALR